MSDLHVVSPRYRLVPVRDGVSFDAPPLEARTGRIGVRLADHELTVSLSEHHATADSARAVVDSFLKARETSAALDGEGIQFEFERAEVTTAIRLLRSATARARRRSGSS